MLRDGVRRLTEIKIQGTYYLPPARKACLTFPGKNCIFFTYVILETTVETINWFTNHLFTFTG